MNAAFTYIATIIFSILLISTARISRTEKVTGSTGRPVKFDVSIIATPGQVAPEVIDLHPDLKAEPEYFEEDTLQFEDWMSDLDEWNPKNN